MQQEVHSKHNEHVPSSWGERKLKVSKYQEIKGVKTGGVSGKGFGRRWSWRQSWWQTNAEPWKPEWAFSSKWDERISDSSRDHDLIYLKRKEERHLWASARSVRFRKNQYSGKVNEQDSNWKSRRSSSVGNNSEDRDSQAPGLRNICWWIGQCKWGREN